MCRYWLVRTERAWKVPEIVGVVSDIVRTVSELVSLQPDAGDTFKSALDDFVLTLTRGPKSRDLGMRYEVREHRNLLFLIVLAFDHHEEMMIFAIAQKDPD
jgi:hypothetical protein